MRAPSRLILMAVIAVGILAVSPPSGTSARSSDAWGPSGDRQRAASAFIQAAEALRRSQSPAGYWRTLVTVGPVFEHAAPELNVFTPAIIVDLLSLVGKEIGLEGSLDRARDYLRREIEPTGLVHYHGDPGPADSARTGCEMPPDADDTSLVWRIAPASDRRALRAALDTLAAYRDGEGLYPTYLAEHAEYRCFYTQWAANGLNRPDVGVEMHVYLLLAKHDPAAAARLCRTLQAGMEADRLWVWYGVAPLLPLLREVDLARSGCPVAVPEHRLVTEIPGQAAYLTQARLLRRLLLNDEASSPEPFLHILREVARERFAAVSRTPPLLYHNDLAASPPHFHWSAEVGYALWLRLYVEVAHRWTGVLPIPAWPAETP